MDKLATMDTIGSSFRPWLSCQGICLLNRHQTGDTDSVQPVILLPVQRDSQETFIPCEARMLWYSADRTSSQQLRDTTQVHDRTTGRDSPQSLPAVWTKISPFFTGPVNVMVQVLSSQSPNPKDANRGPWAWLALYATTREKRSAPISGVFLSTPMA